MELEVEEKNELRAKRGSRLIVTKKGVGMLASPYLSVYHK